MTQINQNNPAFAAVENGELPSALLDEYAGIVKSIKKKGFNFLVAIYNDVSTRNTIIDRLFSLHTASCVIDAAAAKTPDVYDFEQKIQEAAQHSTIEHIINIEYRPDAEFVSFLRSINFHRELLAQLAPVNLVVWILEYRVKDLITIAPDLWSWNSGVFTFTIEKEPLRLEPLPENIEIVELNLASTRERIKSLIEYLTDKLPDNLSDGEKSLLAELLKHHNNMDAYEKTYNFIDKGLRDLRERSGEILDTFHSSRPYVSEGVVSSRPVINVSSDNIQQILNLTLEKNFNLNKNFSHDHPFLGTSNATLSVIYGELGDLEKSINYEQNAVAINEKSLPANHPHLLTSYRHLSSLYRSLGNEEKAREFAAKAQAAGPGADLPGK